jgi:hypothetical protein
MGATAVVRQSKNGRNIYVSPLPSITVVSVLLVKALGVWVIIESDLKIKWC